MNFTNNIDWQKELKNNITSVGMLAELGYIDEKTRQKLDTLTQRYPMSIPRYYLDLIEKKDYSDPIFKMCIASLEEAQADGKVDTSGEQASTVTGGIQHKYDNTVLLLSTNVCAMYCRHCFRKRLVGLTENEILRFTDEALEYIAEHKEVDNVLITGGDALLNSNKVIERYLDGLSKIEHIKFIRFGSRTPVVFPQRISTDEVLIKLFEKYGKIKTIYLVTQFNHPRELTKEALLATDMLRQAGIPVLNQTVLLKGINDSPETLAALFNGLAANGISPYYLFQCRPVKGVKGLFAVPLLEAYDIVDSTRGRLSGIAKRFRFIMSHITGKLEILGKINDSTLVLKQHQARDNEDSNRIFTVEADVSSVWLDDSLGSAV
ncbi:MAG: KamA family radical SAM protein [Clostridia bacterium]|nr:KamA family radical SAM protein [Clostridia bacterium]